MRRALGLAAIGGAAALAAGLGKAISVAADFEQVLDRVRAVSGGTEAQMRSLKEEALDLGAKTKFSAREVAAAEVELAKAGLTVQDILGGALKGALDLAAAGNLELADAATFAANAMNLFGLAGKDVSAIADAFAVAANSTTADVEDFGRALVQGGSAAKAAGLSFQETIVVLEALAEAGIKNSDAGTSMKSAFLQLLTPTRQQADLAKKLNIELLDQAGNLKNAAELSKEFRFATEGMTRAERLATFAILAGQDGVRTLLALYDAGPAKLAKMEEELRQQGVAAETAAKMQDNLIGRLEQWTGAIETFAIRIGDLFIPAVTRAVEVLTALATLLGDVAAGDKSPEVAVKVLFEGVEVAARNLADRIGDALFGAFKRKPLKLKTGQILEWEVTETEGIVASIGRAIERADWSSIGGRLVDGFTRALSGAAELATRFASFIVSTFARIPWERIGVQLGPALATMLLSAFASLTDPAFWARNWEFMLVVAVARFRTTFAALRAVFGFVFRNIGRGILDAFPAIEAAAGRLVPLIVSKVRGLPGAIAGILAQSLRSIGQGIGLWIAAGAQGAARLVAALLSPLGRLAGRVGAVLGQVATRIRGAVASFLSAGAQLGRAIVNGIVSGLASLFSRVASAISGAVKGAIEWVKGNLGSTAEDYAARQIGLPLAEGIEAGFLDGIQRLSGTVSAELQRALGGPLSVPGVGLGGESRLAASPVAAAAGGGGLTVIVPVTVQGNAIYEHDLGETVRAQVIRGIKRGGAGFGGG